MLNLLYERKIEFILIGGIFENNPVLYPGSFNPVHEGHIRAMEFVFSTFGAPHKPVYFELSIGNCDKPDTPIEEMEERIAGLLKYRHLPAFGGILIDDAPLFVDKDILYDNPDYIVGTDTYSRIKPTKQMYSYFHVVPRHGHTYKPNKLAFSDYYDDFTPINISSSEIRDQSL